MIMKNYFYLFLFVTSFIIAEKKSLVDIALTHLNPANKVIVKLAAKIEEQLKTLKQERTKHEQDLITINKSTEEIKKETSIAKDKIEHELPQEVNQILHKIASAKKELISFFDDFIKERELFLENVSSLQLSTSYFVFSSKNMQQLTEIIAQHEKLIDQLTIKKEKIKTIFSFPHNNENSRPPHKKKLNNLKKTLIELQRKKHEIIKYFIELLQKDLSLLKKQTQYNTSSPSIHEPTKPTVHSLPWLLDYLSPSKVAAVFVSLIGGRKIYKSATQKNKQKTVEDNSQTQKTEKLKKEKTFTEIPQEKFSDYYGPIPVEISNICKQLKSTEPLFLIGPGKEFLTKCLAGELKASFLSIPSSLFLQIFLKEGQSPKTTLESIIKGSQKEAKQVNAKAAIIHISQIDLIKEAHIKGLSREVQSSLFQNLLEAIKDIDHSKKDGPPVIVIPSLTDSTWKNSIESEGFRIVEIPYPDEQTRKKVIEESKDLRGKLSIQVMKDLVVDTKGMEISHLQDTIKKLRKAAEEEKSILTSQDIKKILGTKKAEKREALLEKIGIPDCSFPEVGLEQYFGEIPHPLLNFINKAKADNSDISTIRKFFLSAPDESGRKYLAQSTAGQFEAPFLEISLRDLMQPGILQDCILKMQKVGQEVQAKMVVIYIKEDMDLFVEENFSHSVDEDLQKISRDQKRALRNIAEQIKSVKSPTDKTLPNILLLCPLETSKEDLREAGERERESIERFLLDKLAAPDVIEDFLELPFPEEDQALNKDSQAFQ